MQASIGLAITEHIAAGLVRDHRVEGEIRRHTDDGQGGDAVRGVPSSELIERLADEAANMARGVAVEAVGVAFPGIIRDGMIEESPNLPQLKGFRVDKALREALRARGIGVPLAISNDADAVAAGLAITRERAAIAQAIRPVRVWTLGAGIGFGRYPASEGVWEGGHMVVSLDPGENFCACGGKGHLEGIMGHRAMRLRFQDREPEEVFTAAQGETPDQRCREFVKLWHRALAAATATSIHLEGPGRFYITGTNARFVRLNLLNRYVQEMVKMSPLQSYAFEVVPLDDALAVVGAAWKAVSQVEPIPEPVGT